MRKIIVEKIRKIKKAVPSIENNFKIHFSFGKNFVIIKGNEFSEYIVEKIIQAVDFGFDVEDALLLKQEDFVLEFIDVKDFTRRKNLKEVRARLIGRKGKARKLIEELTGAEIVINDNHVGVIVDSAHLDEAIQAVISIIRGAKHSNVFSYLEKRNRSIRDYSDDGLGLKQDVEINKV